MQKPLLPTIDCQLCPRLVSFRQENELYVAGGHNAPVPSFGPLNAHILVVGLAPGRMGANKSGRPFTGDYAGDILYKAIAEHGFSEGMYQASVTDNLVLSNIRITNAVRCAVPKNKALPIEAKTCRVFLQSEIQAMSNLRAILTLGRVAYETIIRVLDVKLADYPFSHGAVHSIVKHNIRLFCSYHCSRYNIQTRRLTYPMFSSVFAKVKHFVSEQS